MTVDQFKEDMIEIYMKRAKMTWHEAYEYVNAAYDEDQCLMLLEEGYTAEDAAYEDMSMWDDSH